MKQQQTTNAVRQGFEDTLKTWPRAQQHLTFIMPTSASAPTTLSVTAAAPPAPESDEITEQRGILRAAIQTVGNQEPIAVGDAFGFTKFKAELSPKLAQLLKMPNGIAALTEPNGPYSAYNGVKQFRIEGVEDKLGGLIRFKLRLMGEANSV